MTDRALHRPAKVDSLGPGGDRHLVASVPSSYPQDEGFIRFCNRQRHRPRRIFDVNLLIAPWSAYPNVIDDRAAWLQILQSV